MHDPAHGDVRVHEHRRPAGPSREGEQRRLAQALLLAVVALVAEAVGGWLSNSLALMSDAAHMIADVGAIGLSLFALRMAARPADARRTYGYYRLEIVGALLNGGALLAIAIGIAIEGYHRLIHPQPVAVPAVVALALVGIALNAGGMWITRTGEHSSMNLRSTFLHLAGDLVNSVGVLVSAAIIYFTGQLAGTITSGLVALSCHIVVICEGPGCRSHDQILTDAKAALREKFGIEHTTIQFESDTYRHEEVVH